MTNTALWGRPDAKTIPSALAILAAACSLAAVTPSIDGAGNYTFEVDGTETYSGVIAGTDITVTKLGDGELTLTGANTFTGTLLVKAGTLVAAPSATAGSPALVVEDRATFKSDGGGAGWTANAIKLASITITGHGVNGQGAFVRASGTVCRSATEPTLKLLGDSTVNFVINHNPGPVNLNGYTLTKIGAGNWDAYNSMGSLVPDGEGGHGGIILKEGRLQVQQLAFTTGSSANVLELAGGAYASYSFSGKGCPWTMKVTANSTVTSLSVPSGNTRVLWKGPVVLDGGVLTLSHNEPDRVFEFTEAVTATSASGNGIVANRGITYFDKDVDIGSGTYLVTRYDTKSTDGPKVEFRGSFSSTATDSGSFCPRKGTTRFVKSQNVSIASTVNTTGDKQDYQGGSTGRVELVDVVYAKLPKSVYLAGTQTIPATLYITNSVCGGGGTINAGSNYSFGILDMEDSIVTNNAVSGGGVNDGYQGTRGAIYQRGGLMHVPGSMTLGAAFGNSHGCYVKEGGVTEIKGNDVYLGNLGYGAMHLNGGTAELPKVTLARGHNPSKGNSSGAGVYWQRGGATNDLYGLTFGNTATTNGIAIAAVEGAGTRCIVGGGQCYHVARCPFTGILAVNDGAAFRVMDMKRYSDAARVEGSDWHISVDGGILEPAWIGERWGKGSTLPDTLTVHSGGMTLKTDSSGDYKWKMPFDAPAGKIVGSIALPDDASFESGSQGLYLAPPLVTISGAGKGAAAVALFDKKTRRVTGIHVVSPGTGYDDGTTATIRPASGAPAGGFACPVTLVDAPVTGAGFTKSGAGTFFFECANTYRGPTKVAEGRLEFVHAESLPAGSGLAVSAGATADLNGQTFTVPTLEGAGTVADGSLVVTNSVTLTMITNSTLQVEGSLTLGDGAAVLLTGSIADLDPDKSNVLLSAAGGIVCEGAVSVPSLPAPWAVLVRAKTIVVRRQVGLRIIIK